MESTPHYRRNYLLLLSEAICFTIGMVFFDANTLLPVLVERLTGSAVWVGIVGMIPSTGIFLASLFSANLVRSLPEKRGFILAVGSLGRLPMWVLAIVFAAFPGPLWTLGAFLIVGVQLLFWVADGLVATAWMEILGKTLPSNRRGRFFATMQIVGGALAVAAGGLLSLILDREPPGFPQNYGLVFAVGAALFSITLLALLGLKEQPSPTSPSEPAWAFVKQIPGHIRRCRAFALAMQASLLTGLISLSLPFFVVFGRAQFGFTGADVGFLISARILGGMLGGVVWGTLGDRFGHEKGVLGVALTAVLPALLASLIGWWVPEAYGLAAFLALYVVIGAATGGWHTFINYILDVCPPAERSLYSGLFNVAKAPVAIAPLLGGLLVEHVGYYPLFATTALLTSGGFLLALRLPASRNQNQS